MGHKAIYLGNSLVLGRNKRKKFFRVKERVKSRIKGWNKHLLSKVGKATLIKSVIQAIPTYIMTTHLLPLGCCEELDALVRKFWWEAKPNASGFLALKAWKDICKPKDLGELGFRRFKDMNVALLAKLGWKLANGEDCLWTRLLKAKYLQKTTFFGYTLKKETSNIWQGLVKTRKLLRTASCFCFGDGSSIDL